MEQLKDKVTVSGNKTAGDREFAKGNSTEVGEYGDIEGGARPDNSGAGTADTAGGKKRGRKRKEKLATDSVEWLAGEPQEVEIAVEGDVPKPRKKRQSTKKMLDTKENIYQIFSVTSMFAGEIWKLDYTEAEMIAKPLDSILARYNLLDRMEKYGDTLALTVALVAVFVPRVIFTINEKREKRREREKAETLNSSGAGNSSSPSTGSADSKDVLQGIFG